MQLILVEPDPKKLGWGVAKLVGFLQDIEVTGDKDDSRCLHITIYRPLSNSSANRVPLLSARFVFDDNIRCMAAKQRLTKGRIKARQKKMQHIARLLDIPGQTGPPSPAYVGAGHHQYRGSGSRLLFHPGRLPGFVTRRDNVPGVIHRTDDAIRPRSPGRHTGAIKKDERTRKETQNRSRDPSANRNRSREGSPRMPRPRSEEIPLEMIKKNRNAEVEAATKITIVSRPQTPKTEGGDAATPTLSSLQTRSSEETSFIAQNDALRTPASNGSKNKGFIETI